MLKKYQKMEIYCMKEEINKQKKMSWRPTK